MKSNVILTFLNLFIGVLLFAQETNENSFSFKWDNGFKIESADKQFLFKFGGRIMLDHAYFNQNTELDANLGPLQTTNSTEIRRGRFFVSGAIYNNVEFKLQADFAGAEVSLKDVYIGIKNIPIIGTLRMGHVKEPFRLETMTSSKYIIFLERSFSESFLPVRNNGVILFNQFFDKKLGVQAGYFRNSDGTANSIDANNGYALTARVTSLLLNNEEKKQLWHVGLGLSSRKIDDNTYKISSRPESHLGLKYINTGTIDNIDKINFTNFETAFVLGSLALQAEYLTANVNMDAATNDYKFSSYYGQASYFLTGENRKYKSSYSGFGRIKPNNNFGGKNEEGSGAWELALRYSHSNLNSEDILGGEQSDVTLGLNWYLNSATRIMLNHVWADVIDTGKASIFQMRFQIDF
ncbi:MAG: porin [Flavobacteriaceae bacterium]|nr:MAG: porin [Flavobacteriaceae bacterium]